MFWVLFFPGLSWQVTSVVGNEPISSYSFSIIQKALYVGNNWLNICWMCNGNRTLNNTSVPSKWLFHLTEKAYWFKKLLLKYIISIYLWLSVWYQSNIRTGASGEVFADDAITSGYKYGGLGRVQLDCKEGERDPHPLILQHYHWQQRLSRLERAQQGLALKIPPHIWPRSTTIVIFHIIMASVCSYSHDLGRFLKIKHHA